MVNVRERTSHSDVAVTFAGAKGRNNEERSQSESLARDGSLKKDGEE